MEHRQLTWHERGQLWLRLGIRIALTAGGLALLFLAGRPLISLFMPFILAFLLAWLLNPLVRTLQRRLGISRHLLSLLLIFAELNQQTKRRGRTESIIRINQ